MTFKLPQIAFWEGGRTTPIPGAVEGCWLGEEVFHSSYSRKTLKINGWKMHVRLKQSLWKGDMFLFSGCSTLKKSQFLCLKIRSKYISPQKNEEHSTWNTGDPFQIRVYGTRVYLYLPGWIPSRIQIIQNQLFMQVTNTSFYGSYINTPPKFNCWHLKMMVSKRNFLF